jgi:isopenicillin-N epimerase
MAPAPEGNPLWGPDWPQVRALWPLDPTVAHLNHGSFGAPPIPVLAEQERWRREMDSNPIGFFVRTLPDALESARLAAAAFVRADPEGFLLVPNATHAVNTVLASIEIGPGDEVMLTDHAYGAVRLAAERWCSRAGASVVIQPVPLPAGGHDELVESVMAGVTDRTRLAIIDQIASPTALVFPAERLVGTLRERGVLSLIDGAHAVGMLDLDLAALDADFWAGNFHKWCCSPRGSAGLFVRGEHRERVTPLITSWHSPEGLVPAFSWTGTADYTPYLAVPAALEFMAKLGWERVRKHNRELAAYGSDIVREATGTPRVVEHAEGLFEAMTLVAMPPGLPMTKESGEALAKRIAQELRAEVAIFPWQKYGFIRLSAQAYNSPADYERLAEGLQGVLELGGRVP